MSWFQVGIDGLIYQNCAGRFRTLHGPSSGVASMYKECFAGNTFTLHYWDTILRSSWKYVHPKGWKGDGLSFGTHFSNFYISDLANKVFNTINKPNIYLSYAVNKLLLSNSADEINITQEIFQNNCFLNFAQEININNEISFLSVVIDTSNIYL